MARGYEQHKERLATIQSLGKVLAKRAEFACEWCGGKDDLRPYDLAPDEEPAEETLALLCGRCREIAGGAKFAASEVRAYEGAVWHAVTKVAEGAAQVLARANEDWAWEVIEGCGLEEAFKAQLNQRRR